MLCACPEFSGACTQLLVPSYGRLLLESADITQSQNAVNISTGDSVVIQCAEGYLLTHTLSNATLSAAQSVTTCSGSGQWTLDIKNLSCVRQTGTCHSVMKRITPYPLSRMYYTLATTYIQRYILHPERSRVCYIHQTKINGPTFSILVQKYNESSRKQLFILIKSQNNYYSSLY